MQLIDFFESITKPKVSMQLMPYIDSMGSQLVYGFESGFKEERLVDYDVAIIGVKDGRNSIGNEGCEDGADVVRGYLAGLRKIPKNINIIDLGNIQGQTLNDRYFAVREVINILASYEVCCVIIGGGQDYVLPSVKGLSNGHDDLFISIIDSKLDLSDEKEDFCSQTFLSQIEKDCKDTIMELNLMGIQNYLVGESQENKITELDWECTRLKQLRDENICSSEPLLRDADLVSFDVGAIQKENMPYFTNINVNGFTGVEACQIAWYAGVGERLKVFCLQEYNPNIDNSGKGGMLCAEIIWHLFDGMSQCIKDIPSESASAYKISVVHLQDFDVDIRFYLNRVNNRWWIEVPWKSDVKMLACDKKDYLMAQSGELPDKWWKYFRKD